MARARAITNHKQDSRNFSRTANKVHNYNKSTILRGGRRL